MGGKFRQEKCQTLQGGKMGGIKDIEKVSNVEKYSYTSYSDFCITNPNFSDDYLKVYPNILKQLPKEGQCLDLIIVSQNEFRRYTKSLGINTNENIQNGIYKII